VAAFKESTCEIAADLVMPDVPDVVLDAETTSQIMRVVQEAMHNVRRHAHATQITVCLDRQAAGYRLAVRDNGCGFEPANVNGKAHFGLNIMQARASRIGGGLVITSAPGQGTEIVLTWPVVAAEERV
jgi:two-component system nitrate/nitrite sensor histidine kinase NarX